MPDDIYPVFTTAQEKQQSIRDNVADAFKGLFPLVGKAGRLELENISVKPKEISSVDVKKAKLQGLSLNEDVRADLVLKNNDGKVIDRVKNHKIMSLPAMTGHHTFVQKGTEYILRNQLRTKPGVYTRRRANDVLESSFNLAKGQNFRVSMDPDKGTFQIEHGNTKTPLYPVLRGLGVSDREIEKAWGKDLAAENHRLYSAKQDNAAGKLYKQLIPEFKQQKGLTPNMQWEKVKDYYQETQLSKETTQSTLGKGFSKVTPESMLLASNKLLRVFNKQENTDERDSLQYQKFLGPEDHLAERVTKGTKNSVRKIKTKISRGATSIKDIVTPDLFTKPVQSFVSSAQLSVTPELSNPVDIIDGSITVTRLGEGGISSDRAIPYETRQVHGSHLGVLDPHRTSEGSSVGVDVRVGIKTHRDKAGNLYAQVKDKQGKERFVKAQDLAEATVAFPNQKPTGVAVEVLKKGKPTKVNGKFVDYQIPTASHMHSPATNLIPFIDGMQGNRTLMSSKFMTQALSVKDREAPLVRVQSHEPGVSFERKVADQIEMLAPVDGTITKVQNDVIHIKGKDNKTHKVFMDKMFPLGQKSYMNHEAKVKVGDAVTKGQQLTDSNYTKDGRLALGKNLKVAYMPYKGLNTEDAIVISEDAAQKMTSQHMTTFTLPVDQDVVIDSNKFKAHFPQAFKKDQLTGVSKGVIKPGMKLKYNDPIVTALRKKPITYEDKILGRLHKKLVRDYSNESMVWDKHVEGEVVDVVKTPKKITVTVKSDHPMQIGDKLANRHGAKGVVSKIVPTTDMPHDASGKPVDVIYTGLGVVSRINPSQIIETAVAKVAEKTGKPIRVDNYADRDNVDWAKKMLKQHGVQDKEDLIDPTTGRTIPKVMVGPQYVMKLFKTTGTNFAARSIGNYDANEQPTKGGESGAKALGIMEINALLGHNARNTLKEATTLKSQRNDEFWRAFQLGLPLPKIQRPFVFNKFNDLVHSAGIKMTEDAGKMTLGPLTDSDINKMSNGAIKTPRSIVSKNLKPEKDGLFDPIITGGLKGRHWSHIDLNEPVINPVFKDPVKRLLRKSTKELDEEYVNKGGNYIKEQLGKIDVDSELTRLEGKIWSAPKSKVDDVVKRIKYLKALKQQNLTPAEAYTLTKVPVLPPVMRPIIPLKGGDIQVDDATKLYRDVMLTNQTLGDTKSIGLSLSHLKPLRRELQQAVGAVVGTDDPVSPQLQNSKVKGALRYIAGTTPKTGFFQEKVFARKQDLSARGTVAPDPKLGMDEIGLPHKMAKTMYRPFVMKRLVGTGYKPVDAEKMIEEDHPLTTKFLDLEMQERPVLVNRAPTLYRFGMIAQKPKRIPGKTVRVQPGLMMPLAGDFDGDAVQLHVPVGQKAVAETNKLMLSNLVLGDRSRDHLLVKPGHEAVMGLYQASLKKPSGRKFQFNSFNEAKKAYMEGAINLDDEVEIK